MNRLASAFVILLATVAAVPSRVCAQSVSLMPLVPAADWRLVSSKGLAVDEIGNYGGELAIEREYGVKSFELRTYQLEGARAEVILEPAADATSAYGLFTYYQNESMHPERGIQFAMSGPDACLMARGRSFVRFLRPKDAHLTESDFHALLVLAGRTRPADDSLANLPATLPPSDLVPGTEKYIIGPEAARRILPGFRTDLIGFDQGAEIHLAQYVVGSSRPTIMNVTYPTPQIARARFGMMSNLLGLNQDRGPDSLYARRDGSYIFLVLHADNNADATKSLDKFRVTRQLSWDEKYPGDKSIGLQLFELVWGNFLLCLILAGGGIAGGVLIVLSRRVAARLFPSWEWGHPEADQLIRLNLK
jgi:hypothetical protein